MIAQRLAMFAASADLPRQLQQLGWTATTDGDHVRITANLIRGWLRKFGRDKYVVELKSTDRRVTYTIGCRGTGGAQAAKTWEELRPILANLAKISSDQQAIINRFEQLSFRGWTWDAHGADRAYISRRRKGAV